MYCLLLLTAVSWAKVAVVYSGEVGRSVVYRMYRSGLRTLLWGKYAFIFNLGEEVSTLQVGC
jgi:hypothetical protein